MTKNDKTKEGLLTVTQVCDLFKITRPTLYNWGISPRLKEGGCNYYDHNELVQHRINEALRNVKQTVVMKDENEQTLESVKIRVAIAQAEKLERINAVAKYELAPIRYVSEVLSIVAAEISGRLDSLPLNIQRQCAELRPNVLNLIKKEIIYCQNRIATLADDPDSKLIQWLNENDPYDY